MGATLVRVSGPAGEPDDALGEQRSGVVDLPLGVTEIAGGIDPGAGAAPARVAARLKALNDFHRAMAGPIALDALLELLLERSVRRAASGGRASSCCGRPDGTLATAASRRLPGATGELLVSTAADRSK